MKNSIILLAFVSVIGLFFTGCTGTSQPTATGTRIILSGESFTSGSEAVTEANLIISNASRSGCKAISVGGYGAGAKTETANEGLIIGVPVLLDCPFGTKLLPNGLAVP